MFRFKNVRMLFSINNAQMETTKEYVVVPISDFNEVLHRSVPKNLVHLTSRKLQVLLVS